MVGGGSAGSGGASSQIGGGGASGAGLYKLLSSGFSGLQVIVGPATNGQRSPYGLSAFGPSLFANAGFGTNAPGSATGGDISFNGNSAMPTVNGITGGGFPGAASPLFGGAGPGGVINGNGSAGTSFGSGGGGGGSNSGSSTSGGNGIQGVVIITEHFI